MTQYDADIESAEKALAEAKKRKNKAISRAVTHVLGACFKTTFSPDYNAHGFESMDKIIEVLPDNKYGNRQYVTEHLWYEPKYEIKEDSSIINVGISVQHEYENGYGYLSHEKESATEREYQVLRQKILAVINKPKATDGDQSP